MAVNGDQAWSRIRGPVLRPDRTLYTLVGVRMFARALLIPVLLANSALGLLVLGIVLAWSALAIRAMIGSPPILSGLMAFSLITLVLAFLIDTSHPGIAVALAESGWIVDAHILARCQRIKASIRRP